MIRVVAILIPAVLGLTAPARACGTKAASTFRTEAGAAPPGGVAGQDAGDGQAGAWPDEGRGTDPPSGGDAIYVEGAVAVDRPAPGDDSRL